MPANPRSLQLTDAYRRRLLALGEQAEREARAGWPTIETLDDTSWPERTAQLLSQAQLRVTRLSAGYLGAYLRAESGRGTVPRLDTSRYVGVSRDGRPLPESLESPIIGVRAALKAGRSLSDSLRLGLGKALRTVTFETVQTGRDALLDTIEADERFEGWKRAVAGTCAACMALSGDSAPRFEVHPGCQCLPLPSVRGVPERIALPTGAALFASLTAEEQEKTIGPEAAEKVRTGEADLKDFVGHSAQAEQPDYITQAPVKDAT